MGGIAKLFGGGAPVQKPLRMADTDKTDEIENQRRRLRKESMVGGRASTNLSPGGAGSYMSDTLGS